jgi:ribonuclease-3
MAFEDSSFELIEKKIKYKFKNASLLRQALTHSSYVFENKMEKSCSNERLEFLGDALLGFVVGRIVFDLFPAEAEGVISKIKGYWVSAKVLSKIAEEIGLHSGLLLGSGEEKSGGRKNGNNLTNAFEALVAAVYLDGGIRKADGLITRLFKKRIEEMGTKVILFDFKTRLQEVYQEKYKDKPKYFTEYKTDHFVSKAMFRGRIIGKGSGSSKKNAEQEAAKLALEKIEKRKRGF